jgi:acrylyl-CoA reductase (NADPH)
MTAKSFKAFVTEEIEEKKFKRSIQTRNINSLEDGEVLINVKYSSLNYKDALSATGNKGVTRNYPHTPGIDAAGIVEESSNSKFKAGDEVIVTSYDLGMNTSGGFGQYIRVPAEWIVKLPKNMTLKESMIYGTAGFTAGMSVHFLQKNILPDSGDVLVSGATGGVGSMAVAILSKLGFKVVAVTGKKENEFLKKLGASNIISREEMDAEEKVPMLKARWAGVIDTVGGTIMDNAIKSTKPYGIITTCGLVASPKLNLTVFPFILRGISLIGVDSQNFPMNERQEIWNNLAEKWRINSLHEMYTEIGFDELDQHIQLILQGKIKGRTILNLDK